MTARLPVLILGLLCLTLLPSCKKQDDASSAGGPEVPKGPIKAKVEKSALTLGIVAKAQAAPIVVGQTQGLFKKHKLTVTPQVLPREEAVLSAVLAGTLDAGMVSPGMVLAAAASDAPQKLIVPCVLARNGATIQFNRATWDTLRRDLPTDGTGKVSLPVASDALIVPAQAQSATGSSMTFGVESPHSSAAYLLRYWLAAGGILSQAGQQVATPRPSHPLMGQCVVNIVTDTTAPLTGLAASAPATFAGESPVTAITSYGILKNHPSAVLVVSEGWASAHPSALQALIRGLHAAGQWLDASVDHRKQAARDLATASSADLNALTTALTGEITLADGETSSQQDHLIFGRYHAMAPDQSHAMWTLTQLVRWGQLAGDRSDDWYVSTVSRVFRKDLYQAALGQMSATVMVPLTDFIDGNEFDPAAPSAYLKGNQVGLH